MFDWEWQPIALPIQVKEVSGDAWWYHKLTFTRPPMDLFRTIHPFVARLDQLFPASGERDGG
jgi:hypothetical protein